MAYRIVTNNVKVLQALRDEYDTTAVEGFPFDVYEAAERFLQEGWRLVTAPLPPNVPLIRSPYRSLIMKRSPKRYDASGILMIEKAKEKLAVLGTVDRPEGREDFASIDLDLLKRAMNQLAALRQGSHPARGAIMNDRVAETAEDPSPPTL